MAVREDDSIGRVVPGTELCEIRKTNRFFFLEQRPIIVIPVKTGIHLNCLVVGDPKIHMTC